MRSSMSGWAHDAYSEERLTDQCRLWRAVLRRAVQDCFLPVREDSEWASASRMARREAVAWFWRNTNDFKQVCDMAGYNSDLIRTNVIRAIRVKDVKIHDEEIMASKIRPKNRSAA